MGKEENTKVMWHEVYPKLVLELNKLDDEEKRRGFFKKCINNEEFVTLHSWAKNFFDKSNIKEEVGTFDPLHIFASFNGFGMNADTRTKKINLYFKILGSERNYENIEFSGCPTPMILPLVFVRTRKDWKENAHVNHKEEQEAQGKIWEAIKQVIKQEYSSINFKGLQQLSGVNLNSFSLLLFWIDSKNFLPLDKNTLALFETNNEPLPTQWDKYLEFLKPKQNTDIYQIITSMAWEGCSYETLDKDTRKLLKNQFGIKKCPKKSLKIVAIKPLNGCNPSFLKGLKEEQIYLFDKAYSIDDNGNITYHKEKDIQLFNQDDLQVNINAIVGKNGTGKSTLVELLLATINNIIYQNNSHEIKSKIKSEFKKKKDSYKYNWTVDKVKKLVPNSFKLPINCISYINDLNIDLIFEDLHLYKIQVNNSDIKIKKYDEEKSWIKNNSKKYKLFYNILVNYSIHSLSDDWIEPHFQNNCHTDIMIEPFREKGNINIQKEEKRVKERLIVNLLEPEEDGYNFRQLTSTLKANKIIASLKKGKKRTKFFNDIYSIGYDEVNRTAEYFISDLSERIDRKRKEDENIDKYLLNDYIDDILLDNSIKFSQLSSGEKQKIYSINSIVYHIKEIDRKKKHKHINLILDEIELYFHPELQRTYISDVIKAIKKVGTENILGINITFITHSPFILSDIPESKILFLGKESKDIDAKTVPQEKSVKTFGANIHTLLSGSFFMENGLIGEFAKNKIQEIVDFYNEVKNHKKTKDDYQKVKKEFYFIRDNIGEEYIQGVITNHIEYIEKILGDDSFKTRQIKQLEAKLKLLKGIDD